MNNTLAVVEKAGNLTIAEEDQLRSRLEEMEEALEKEQSSDRAIEDKIKVTNFFLLITCSLQLWGTADVQYSDCPELSLPCLAWYLADGYRDALRLHALPTSGSSTRPRQTFLTTHLHVVFFATP